MTIWPVLDRLLVIATGLVYLSCFAHVDGRIVTNVISAATGDMYRTDRVVAGTEVPEDAVQWVASIQNSEGLHFCGGTVVSAHWVLTAAHCMMERASEPESIKVVTGSTFLHSSNMQTRVADRIIVADYNKDEKYNDLALIHLSEPISCTGSSCEQRSYISGMPLARSEALPGRQCWVLGWGAVGSGGSMSVNLMAAKVDPMSRDECQQDLPHYRIYSTMLCAGGDSTDACQGDSGGPLVCSSQPADVEQDQPWSAGDLQLAGAVSWGIGCASPGIPGVYADVYAMKEWINSVVNSTDSMV